MNCGTFILTKKEKELASIIADFLSDDGWHIMEDTMYSPDIDIKAENKSIIKLVEKIIEW